MRLSLPRGRCARTLALSGALVVPAAVSAAGTAHGRVTPPYPQSARARTAHGGEAPDIFLVQLSDGADTFRKQAKAVGLNYTERFAYESLFKGCPSG